MRIYFSKIKWEEDNWNLVTFSKIKLVAKIKKIVDLIWEISLENW